jgi:protein-S-isoprenylcysteine O-methyltransferase Ste14
MKWLELKMPPPAVALLCALGMWLLAQYTPAYLIAPLLKWSFVVFFILLGATFNIAGLIEFNRSKTTINPLQPEKSSALVSGGIYKITRNPMYCGMVAFLIAWMSYLENSTTLIGVFFFMWYITQFQIKPEEKILAALFGEAYIQYQQRVRRWL